MAERNPAPRARWSLVIAVALMAVGAVGNAVTGPTWGRALQAVGLVVVAVVAVRWARTDVRGRTRWAVAGGAVLWALGTVVSALTAPAFGPVLMAAGALGLSRVAVGWARAAT